METVFKMFVLLLLAVAIAVVLYALGLRDEKLLLAAGLISALVGVVGEIVAFFRRHGDD